MIPRDDTIPKFVFVWIFLSFINVPSDAVETGERLMNGRMERRGEEAGGTCSAETRRLHSNTLSPFLLYACTYLPI